MLRITFFLVIRLMLLYCCDFLIFSSIFMSVSISFLFISFFLFSNLSCRRVKRVSVSRRRDHSWCPGELSWSPGSGCVHLVSSCSPDDSSQYGQRLAAKIERQRENNPRRKERYATIKEQINFLLRRHLWWRKSQDKTIDGLCSLVLAINTFAPRDIDDVNQPARWQSAAISDGRQIIGPSASLPAETNWTSVASDPTGHK